MLLLMLNAMSHLACCAAAYLSRGSAANQGSELSMSQSSTESSLGLHAGALGALADIKHCLVHLQMGEKERKGKTKRHVSRCLPCGE